MKVLSYNEQIEYLLQRKFGNILRGPLPVSIRTGPGGKFELHREFLEDIQRYKEKLEAQSPGEIKAFYEQEKAKEQEAYSLKVLLEENQRFFNQPNAQADFKHWSKAAHWSLDEAIALSFGKAPEIVNWKSVQPFKSVSSFAADYARRRDLALRAIPWKKLYDPVLPSIFLSWAKEVEIVVPDALIAEVERMGGTNINWKELYQDLNKRYSEYVAETTQRLNEIIQKHSEPKSEQAYSTPLTELAHQAITNFFEPRQTVDARQEEVVEWIKEQGKHLIPPVSDNIATAIFTIIKPTDHNPRKRRNQ